MDMAGYISTAWDYRPVQLDEMQEQFLRALQFGNHLTVYKFHRLIPESKRIAYKNVNLKIKRLEKSGLIKVAHGKFEHGARPYTLTTLGWLHLIIDGLFDSPLVFSQRSRNTRDIYMDNTIFQTLLLPYFTEESLEKLSDSFLRLELVQYLQETCHRTVRHLEKVKKDVPVTKSALKTATIFLTSELLSCANSLIVRLATIGAGPESKQYAEFYNWYEQYHRHMTGHSYIVFETRVEPEEVREILAEDKRFSKALDDLHKKFNRSHSVIMDMRVRS